MSKYIHACLVVLTALTVSGCGSRSSTSMWENTKTATRYIGRGFRALGGGGEDSRLLNYPYEFQGPEDAQYLALYDEDSKDDTVFPMSKEVPGEMGSFLPGIDGFHDPLDKEVSIFKHIHFDTNMDQIHSKADAEIIRSVSKFLKKNPDYYVYIEGHCDERGPALFNMSLGSKRSNTVRSLLIQEGVDLNRLFTVSYGKEKPLVEGHNPVAWEKNRRVQFKLYKKN